MCTELKGKKSWFLPFNKGFNNGAGNPPNPNGIKTDYLWKEILTKDELSNIIENYAQVIAEKDEDCLEKFRTTRPLESGCLIVPLIQHIKRTIIRQVYNTH